MTNLYDPGSSMPLPDQAALPPPSQPPALDGQKRNIRPPSLALLATLLFNPIILVGYYLYLYGPVNTCMAGSLICNFGDYPAILQVVIILSGCVAIWLLLYLVARWLVEASYGDRNALIRGLRSITDTSRIRPLLLAYGLLLLLGLCIGLLKHEVNPPIVILCLFTTFACLHSALDSSTTRKEKPPVERSTRSTV